MARITPDGMGYILGHVVHKWYRDGISCAYLIDVCFFLLASDLFNSVLRFHCSHEVQALDKDAAVVTRLLTDSREDRHPELPSPASTSSHHNSLHRTTCDLLQRQLYSVSENNSCSISIHQTAVAKPPRNHAQPGSPNPAR